MNLEPELNPATVGGPLNRGGMNFKADKVLVVESDEALRERMAAVLSDAGYEVSTEWRQAMKAVLAFNPDAVVLGAYPPELDCCDLVSEIKGSEHTHNIRVLMLSPGGSGERTRGLDLGADDVLSLPFDPHELLSRVRSQLRQKHMVDEFRDKLRVVDENRNATQEVVIAVNQERRALRVGSVAVVAALIISGLAFLIFYRRTTQEQNTRVYAAITRLQTGVLMQQQLLERVRRGHEDAGRGVAPASDTEKTTLQQKSEKLRSQLASSNAANASVLQNQLTAVESRLHKLEAEGTFAEAIIRSYESSVCLIHVVVAFRDHSTGTRLHYAGLTSSGEPTTDEHNNPLVSLTGNGPEVSLDVFGTGFLVSDHGEILTNHHVAEPWWQEDKLKEMIDQGLKPEISEMTAYFPGVPRGVAINTEKISSDADVAVVKGSVAGLGIKEIAFADGHRGAISGGPVVLLGYPTGLDAILARAGAETLRSIASVSKGEPKQVMEELARHHLIRPIVTQGHIGDVLPDKIIYDAQTTSGGSGGPLFNHEGKVIGVNFAMVREFGGSNFAIPAAYAKSLLNR
jgi:DNA-binding response OmpR family regulator